MRKAATSIFMGIALVMISACASPEWRAERDQCRSVWFERIPADYQQRTVQRTRRVEVPDGNYTCTTTGPRHRATTNCTQGTRIDHVPYTVVETFDANESRRDAQIRACTTQACIRRYGNPDCEVPEQP